MHDAGRGRGKGVAVLQKHGLAWEIVPQVEKNMQILKCVSENLEVINVYRSKDKSLVEAADSLKDIVNGKKPTLIIGDFNVCVRKKRNNVITQCLSNLGFQQLIGEATHLEGNIIDHVYWKDVDTTWENPNIERYSPYFSDHDSHLITLKLVKTFFQQ